MTMSEKINSGFWEKLKKPIFVLAPMHDVTDAAFRNVIAKYGKPDVFYTEFVSTEALMSEKGHDKVTHYLKFSEIEHPIIAQVFGAKSEKFFETTKLVASLGFDGIDINMGCPEKNAVRGGSCAGLFHTPDIAKELILACKRGAEEYAKEHPEHNNGLPIPVSIKIRIGDTKVDWENWISNLLEAKPAAIAIHLRTRKEMSKVDAHWEEMPKIVKFINEHTTPEDRPVIIGNGDVQNIEQAQKLIDETNCDGVMLGRAIFGNPWLFAKNLTTPPTLEERLAVLIEHTKLYEKLFKGTKPFDIMKRHFKAYVAGFNGAAELRGQMFETKSAEELEDVVKKFLATNPDTSPLA